MAVVKNEAYGHGMLPVANYLKDKVEWFCVAWLEEAIKLRESGIENPILVFSVPPKGKEGLYKKYDITASISHLAVFERLKKGTSCHLQFDTGMFRLGMLPEEISDAVAAVEKYSGLNYTGIYTHFACSDEKNHKGVKKQIELFKNIRSHFSDDLMAHTSNSGGIFYYGEETQFDAVRPGVCLYGYAPGEVEIPELSPVIEWTSHLVQVKPIKKGDLVGYGSRWQAPEDGWLGIVPVGYSDGLFRSLSGKFDMEISGSLYPQVGTISMDYSAVFLGSNKFSEGQEVTLLRNGELSAKTWAQKAGTIPYEITTAIKPKVKRKYIGA